MAHKKAGGSSRNGRDSPGQRLGVKRFGGQSVSGGEDSRPSARHQNSIRVQTSALAAITRSCPLSWAGAVRD